MGELTERVKLSLLTGGNGIADNFKKNSLYFFERYKESTEDVRSINIKDIFPGNFYYLQYLDESNWLKYSPVFVADYKKFSNKVVIMAINFNFIPMEIRVLLFDKYITKKDFEKNSSLKVDYQGVYDELRRLGFEYALMEYDASRILTVHKISLNILPRFLYQQHPINKYDPEKLMDIWEVKLEKRDARHKEMTVAILNEFYDINSEISEKYDVLRGHIQRLQRGIKKY